MATHQWCFENASVKRRPKLYAELPHKYLSWSSPSTSSTKLKSSTGLSFPYGSRINTCGIVKQQKRESSESRNESHFVFCGFALSKILAMSRGSGIWVKLSIPNMPGAVARTSTFALNSVTLPFTLALANNGWKKALAQDVHLRNGLNVCEGKITCEPVAQAHNLAYVPAETAIGM